jgi:hypothetical protein
MAKNKRSTVSRVSRKAGHLSATPVAFSTADGRELAVEMLREVEGKSDDCCIDPHCRLGKVQDNILVRYLRVVRERGSLELEEGFGEVLSDFIASSIAGATPDAEFYEERIHAL